MRACAVLGKTWYVGLPDEKISRGTQSRSNRPRNSRVPCAWTTRQPLASCFRVRDNTKHTVNPSGVLSQRDQRYTTAEVVRTALEDIRVPSESG